jgi:hypothetical protein
VGRRRVDIYGKHSVEEFVMSESIDVRTMQIRQVAGVVARWIARPYCPLTTVAKTLVSLVSRYGLAPQEVDGIIARVHGETVAPFFDPPWSSGHERIVRLDAIARSLCRPTNYVDVPSDL